MTIPWMMNCSHKGDGWCLECVCELGQAYADLQEYVGNNIYQSDYQCVDDMRKTLEYYETKNKKLEKEVKELEKRLYILTYDDGCMFGRGKYD